MRNRRGQISHEEAGRMFWVALGVIYIGGIALYYRGVRPQDGFSREVIPVNEPSLIDWITIGGMMVFS